MPEPIEANQIGGNHQWPRRIWVAEEEFAIEWFWRKEPFRDGYEGWMARTTCRGHEISSGGDRPLEVLATIASEIKKVSGSKELSFRVELPMTCRMGRDV